MDPTQHSPEGETKRRSGAGFVGRERQLGDLRVGLQDAAAGRGGLFLLSGDPGIGKTRLAEEVCATAREWNIASAWGRCCEGGGAPAFWPWIQLLRALLNVPGEAHPAAGADTLATLASLLPELSEGVEPAPGRCVTTGTDQTRFALFDRLGEALRGHARSRTLLLVLDDLHAADLPSLLFLDLLARSLRDSAILVIGTYRDAEMQRNPERQALWQGIARHGQVLPLSGLSQAEVTQLMRGLLQKSPPESMVTSIYTRSEGNPLFVDGLVRLLSAEPRTGEVKIPGAVRDVIRSSLAHLSAECRRLLDLICVVGREAEVAILLNVTHLDGEALLELILEGRAAGVLEPVGDPPVAVRFRHILIRDVLYDDLPASERIRRHRSVGEALETAHSSEVDALTAELAHHFAQAAMGGDGAKAVFYGRRAAERAAAQLGYEEAARLYRRVIEILGLSQRRDLLTLGETYLALGEVESAAGDVAAREALRRAADIARSLMMSRRAEAEALLARAIIAMADRGLGMPQPSPDPEIREGLHESLAAIGDRQPALRSRLIALLAMEHSLDEQSDACMQGSADAVDLARRVGDPAVLAAALRARHFVLWRRHIVAPCVEVATEIVELAQRCGDAELEAQGRAWLLIDHMTLGELGRFDAELGRFAQLAAGLRQPRFAWMVATAEAVRALWKGQWQEAERQAVHALALGERTGDTNAMVPPWVQMFLLRRERDGVAEEEIKARFFVERFPASPTPRCFLALVLAELGRRDEARAELERLAAEDFTNLKREQRIGLLPPLAEICAAVGDARRAEVLYGQLLPYADLNMQLGPAGFLGSAHRFLALLAETVGRSADALRHATTAVRENERMGGDVCLAWSRFDLARLLLKQTDLGQPSPDILDQAAELLDLAQLTAERLPMKRLAELAKSQAEHLATLRSPQALPGASQPPLPGERTDLRFRATAQDTPNTGVFHLDGELWLVGVGSDRFRLRDTKGLHYIAHLLRHPDQDVHVLDLAGEAPGEPYPQTAASLCNDVDLRIGSFKENEEPILDARGRAAYRQRLRDLRHHLDEARGNNDAGQISRVQAEIGFLEQELTRAVGFGGRHRATGSQVEKARLNVSRAIKAVLRRIGSHSAALGRSLETTIKTGTFCCYTPDPRFPIRWQLQAGTARRQDNGRSVKY